MKILVIGSSGTIGSQIVKSLSTDHEIIEANKNSGDFKIDILSTKSIQSVFDSVGEIDAIVCAAGNIAFKAFSDLSREDWDIGINSRLMGQINLTQIGSKYLRENGSITLTSGIVADYPIAFGTSAATLNGAIEHFVQSVALELPKSIRINVVSPAVVTESLSIYSEYFPGFNSITSKDLARYYVRSILGIATGQTLRAFAGN